MNWRSTIVVFLAAAITSIASSNCEAQIRSPHRLGRRVMQWGGHGWGPGYHYCNPGPNTDYYQPWTAHNSYLLSEQPGHSGANPRPGYGIPYSIYANGANQNPDMSPIQPPSNSIPTPVAPVSPEINVDPTSPNLRPPNLDRASPPERYPENSVDAIRNKLDGGN
jgi:hypothetical protein